jgi:tRNA isopentenyl-2-thiomethyl-A-37 hydroxylase MiaE
MKLTARVACKSMDRAQEQQHLVQANGHIAELKVQIVRQRVIVKYALDTGQSSQMVESLLHALEESLGAFEKHRELVLDQLKRRPSE